jgi:hypothetical protein
MKKNTFCLLLILFSFAANTFAQTSTKGFMGMFEYSGNETNLTNLKGKDFKSHNIIISAGYNFNKYISARIPLATEIALFEKDDIRDHAVNTTLGLCVGFNIINTAEDLLEINVSTGNTLFGKYDWKYMYYDCSINWGNAFKAYPKFKYNIGLGLRYYNAHRDIENRMVLYAKLGFRIN